MRRALRGFTFVEILLTTALLALLSLAIFTAFSNGLRLWDRVRQAVVAEDVAIFLDRIGQDLRNSFVFSTIPFEGEGDQCSFPSIVHMPADRRGSRAPEGTAEGIGRVRYVFDAAEGIVWRSQADYGQAFAGQWDGAPRAVLKDVSEVRFQYFSAGEAEAHEQARSEERPPAVVKVTVRHRMSGEERQWERLIALPLGL
ncbi:MAG: hypothetical protein GX606_00185 [Elusimicrobia bacterium]|nr:hypothetical protein [Elusimicrobiota bacterium]